MRRAALLFLLLFTLAPAVADEDSARYFTRRGREALAEGNHAEAEKQFTKALSEHTGFLPAIFGLAETARARDDRDSAIRLLEECLDVARGAVLSSEEADVVQRAQGLLKELDRARLEFRRLRNDYVEALLELARKSEEKDPELSRRCADRVIRLEPEHPEAREMLGRLGGPATAGGAPGGPAAEGGKNETVLFGGTDTVGWEGVNSLWVVKGGLLVADIKDGAYYVNHRERLAGDYTLSVTMRIAEDRGRPLVALSFGLRATYDRFDFGVFVKTFTLARYNKSKEEVYVGRADHFEAFKDFDRSAWHTYAVKVEGLRVSASIDGKVLFTHEAEAGAYDGVPSLLVQNCLAEIRKIWVTR